MLRGAAAAAAHRLAAALPPSLLQRFAERRVVGKADLPAARVHRLPQAARGRRAQPSLDARRFGWHGVALAADIVYENCPARECPSHRRPWNRVVADAMPFHLRQATAALRQARRARNFMTDGYHARLLRDNRKCLGLTGEALTGGARCASDAARLRRPDQLVARARRPVGEFERVDGLVAEAAPQRARALDAVAARLARDYHVLRARRTRGRRAARAVPTTAGAVWTR